MHINGSLSGRYYRLYSFAVLRSVRKFGCEGLTKRGQTTGHTEMSRECVQTLSERRGSIEGQPISDNKRRIMRQLPCTRVGKKFKNVIEVFVQLLSIDFFLMQNVGSN